MLCFTVQETQASLLRLNPKSKEMKYNLTVDQLYAPEVGISVHSRIRVFHY